MAMRNIRRRQHTTASLIILPLLPVRLLNFARGRGRPLLAGCLGAVCIL